MIKHKENECRWLRIAGGGIMVVYLLGVSYVTLFNRIDVMTGNNCMLAPFWSYRSAWYSLNMELWREIVLNIIMLVPFGFLLPILFPPMKKGWLTYLTGFGLSLVIESIQLVTGKGLFEVDDLIDNTIGSMIGYGLFILVRWGYEKNEKHPKGGGHRAGYLLLWQIPLMVTVGCFAVLSIVYHTKELGNLSCHYVVRQNLQQTDIKVQTTFSQKECKEMVYRLVDYKKKELHERAEGIFTSAGSTWKEIDCELTNDRSVCYEDQKNGRVLWMDYAGGTFTYTDALQVYDEQGVMREGQPNATRTDIEKALDQIGMRAPEACIFEDMGDGQYRFIAQRITDGELMYDGSLVCNYNVNGGISRVDNEIRKCKTYKKMSLRTEESVYQDLIDGKFMLGWSVSDDFASLDVKDISIGYLVDSKNYYQPVYEVEAVVNGEETVIDLPAVK